MASGSGWNLWVWLAGGGCGWNLWVWLEVVVVRRYRFPHITYPYSSCIIIYLFFFAATSLLFVHFLCFSFLYNYSSLLSGHYIILSLEVHGG